jgi:hypothetical protein
MAEEYVRFISKNAGANYISWDKEKKKFSLWYLKTIWWRVNLKSLRISPEAMKDKKL